MLQSFYNGLSGLFSFSGGLNVVSDNISNMNTPGFRGSSSFFRNVSGADGGLGSSLVGQSQRLNGGEIRETQNNEDLAIDGRGFFVLRNDEGALVYTRAGQFKFDGDGFLVDRLTGFQVMTLDGTGGLSPTTILDARTLPAVATTRINFIGELNATDPGNTAFVVNNINVFDIGGGTHTLRAQLTHTAPNRWSVVITDAGGAEVGRGEIAFNPDQTPMAGANEITITITANGQQQSIAMRFGEPESFSGTIQRHGATNSLVARAADGHGIVGLSSITFDEDGQIKFVYSNGEKSDGSQLALAFFSDEGELRQLSGSLYQPSGITTPQYGFAAQGNFGKIKGGFIELSNVDLTQEFADMMIIQRGYQASSRIMSVSNELIETLYNSTRG